MSSDPVRAIAQAVLYEGYLLWPYRRSALKNQQRFTFGGVYPATFAVVGGDRSAIRMECLLEVDDDSEAAVVEVTLRWLHLVARQPLRRRDGEWRPVDELTVGRERYLAWEEATERECAAGGLRVDALTGGISLPVEVGAGEEREQLDPDAALGRTWEGLEGVLELRGEPVGPTVVRLSVSFRNTSGWSGRERPGALKRSFLSAHVIASCRGGAFVSSTDPPEPLREPAGACRNEGVWPVLVGEPGQRDTMLGSPIILSDYPSVAPESPGDLFDGGEIDALLIHSIRGLAETEREEMRATDARTREILDRSLELTPEEMLKLYGAVRDMRRVQS
jgi:hypothetical protein